MNNHNIKKAESNAQRYAKSRSLATESVFGYGKDGYVMQTTKATAIKAFYDPAPFQYELEIYRYLKQWKITEVAGFHIPELIGSDEGLRVIEMSVVMPPFILDFVEAQIDRPIDRDDETILALAEMFESDWDRVKVAIWQLEEHGVYLADIHPRNICCLSVQSDQKTILKRTHYPPLQNRGASMG